MPTTVILQRNKARQFFNMFRAIDSLNVNRCFAAFAFALALHF